MGPDGEEVEIITEASTDHSAEEEDSGGENCHFHAGVEYVALQLLYPVFFLEAC